MSGNGEKQLQTTRFLKINKRPINNKLKRKIMKYTREQMEKRVLNYLMKTSKHLFLVNGKFYKSMVTKVEDDKWVRITVRWDSDKVDVVVRPIVINNSPNHTTDLANIQDSIFPKWEKHESIPYFKEAREKMFEILKSVRKHYDGTNESLNKIKEDATDILKGMQYRDVA
jgi:hypothetical protein